MKSILVLLLSILWPVLVCWAAPPTTLNPTEGPALPKEKPQPKAEYCCSESSNPYRLFGSWTSYFAVDNERAEAVEMPGCRPKSFWLFVRHGSRRPAVSQIEATNTLGPAIKNAVVKNHMNNKGHLCGKDLGAFIDWQPHLTEKDDHLLVQAGRDEMKQLGQRFKTRLPSLFETFDSEEVIFRSTKTQRTIESAREFFEGAFPNYEFELPPPILNDTVLRFYKFCKKFKDLDNIEEGSKSLEEMEMFEDSDIMRELVNRVNERLGFTDTKKLSFSHIYVMWDTCRYEMQADETPVFCSPFTKEDLQIMEYHEELKYWRSHGFGGQKRLNRLVACPLMENMAAALENNRVTVHFGHQDGLTTLLTMMGINEDPVAPTHDNYVEVTSDGLEERKYRMSKMNPMGGNFGVLLSECDLEPKQRVVAYLQEKPVNLPGCNHTECDFELFKQIYQEAIQCPYDEVCGNDM